MTPEKQKKIEETKASLEKIQTFDVKTLARTETLGETMNFGAAVAPAQALVDLYRQISIDVLPGLPLGELHKIKEQADGTHKKFQSVLAFNLDGDKPKATRDALVTEIENSYDTLWTQVHNAISYSVRKSMDFASLEREARNHIQAVQDIAKNLEQELQARKVEADATLAAIKKVAAEQGVSQHAIHFKDESEKHDKEAENWLELTKKATLWLGGFAVVTLFFHKIPWIAPTTEFEVLQVVVSKILVFATIASFVLLAAKNFMAHRHNAVVNKHRQNALITYEALVAAAKDVANKEVILTHASECIYSPQPTGFGRAEKSDGTFSMVNVAGSLKGPSKP